MFLKPLKCSPYLGTEPDTEVSGIFCCSCNVSGHSQVKGLQTEGIFFIASTSTAGKIRGDFEL